ncbi:MAG: hypothetical protein H8E46_04300 [FCB group bacterium]|nr:hypothetical protein [FCB group bacterium]
MNTFENRVDELFNGLNDNLYDKLLGIVPTISEGDSRKIKKMINEELITLLLNIKGVQQRFDMQLLLFERIELYLNRISIENDDDEAIFLLNSIRAHNTSQDNPQ